MILILILTKSFHQAANQIVGCVKVLIFQISSEKFKEASKKLSLKKRNNNCVGKKTKEEFKNKMRQRSKEEINNLIRF